MLKEWGQDLDELVAAPNLARARKAVYTCDMKIIYQVEVTLPEGTLAVDWAASFGRVFRAFRLKGWKVRCLLDRS